MADVGGELASDCVEIKEMPGIRQDKKDAVDGPTSQDTAWGLAKQKKMLLMER